MVNVNGQPDLISASLFRFLLPMHKELDTIYRRELPSEYFPTIGLDRYRGKWCNAYKDFPFTISHLTIPYRILTFDVW